MFKPCVVIPVYNHHQRIASVLQRISESDLPCIVVDDGSSSPCKEILEAVCAEYADIALIRLSENQGKGGAVCCALRAAFAAGYSHALQVDADGQHDLNDIPKFIAEARQYPAAIVTAVRIASNQPKARRWGRWITDFWVWVNTLSFQIKDSMCGYRLYPLTHTISLIDRIRIGQRMDFDTDILVRLSWEAVQIRQITTHVIYQDDVPSHFRMLADNFRISRMHTRLFFGMLRRLPKLLLMKMR